MWEYRIKEIEDCRVYEVAKPDGTIYTVQVAGDHDGDPWVCDCPAGKHERRCKHLKMVADHISEQRGIE